MRQFGYAAPRPLSTGTTTEIQNFGRVALEPPLRCKEAGLPGQTRLADAGFSTDDQYLTRFLLETNIDCAIDLLQFRTLEPESLRYKTVWALGWVSGRKQRSMRLRHPSQLEISQ